MYKFYFMRKTFTLYLLLSLMAFPFLGFTQSKSQAFEISKNLDIYATLFKELNNNYVDEIKPGDLNKTAIDAMLKSLDPYTVFIPESQIEEVKYLTTGEYGGIGISVIKRNESVIIATIEENSPALDAGLLAGDEILSIDNQDLSKKTDEEIGSLMQGQVGTPNVLKIKRMGIEQPFEKTVTRRNLNVVNIPYYGMIDSNVAYISLLSFTKDAALKTSKAFLELKQKNPKGLIFDLRGNGGGLIGEAVDILNLFVEKDVEVVQTKSRLRDKNYKYMTRKEPVDKEIPIVILVDRNSASAAEIVSGAAQDLDRAVIIGERTYGKGLVQNVVPVSFNSQLKVTIAKYYIPSGRCIQAIDYSHKDADGNALPVNDSLLAPFKTKNGRTVFDGRGIKPDILLSPNDFSDFASSMIDNFYIFDFATQYRLQHDSLMAAEKFEISSELWGNFEDFLKNKDLNYQSEAEKKLTDLQKEFDKSEEYKHLSPLFNQALADMQKSKVNALSKNRPEIERILKTDLVSRYYFGRGVIVANIHQDKAIAKARELINQPQQYYELLKPTTK